MSHGHHGSSNMSKSTSNSVNSNSSSRQNKRPTPLRMMKEEVRQYRPPVIIHTFSPKIIHVDAANFSTRVQELTGRGLKRKPECSPRPREYPPEDQSCASPSSSADSGLPGAESGVESTHGFASPRGPLVSFDPVYHHQHHAFEPSCASAHQNAASANEQASNLFANAVIAAAGPQYSPLFGAGSGPHLFSPLPSPNFLSSSFMQDLPPILSPGPYGSQTFDPYNSHFNPSPTYGRYGASAGGISSLPSPGSSTAFKDMALMMSRDSKG
ncbi:MAP kinase substrate 1 [Marchantia polymorpha subsp. ruderalis]|nr:hypothetical protein MARPO_0010s0102 [Marchantia polymorpha]BBN12865.1 hypothetical protein Mp_5g23540 [Marchantia polymorpha subsp. ruderalis]|eukprot:PTQ46710.1 hypothetical protein MARPO_0010s0102 [Marchantia polymorpha]